MDVFKYGKASQILLLILAISMFSTSSMAQDSAIDPAAVDILKNMTDFLSSQETFSVHTENTIEEQLENGQRIDLGMSASILIQRPNKLRAERVGEAEHQAFYYDGRQLTMYTETDSGIYYASEPAPGTLEELVDYAREDLGIALPVSDFVYRNVQEILMQGVETAMVLGEATVGDMTCNHLAFRRPDIDFQVWVAASGPPLPCKYVVTDTSFSAPISTVSVLSDWNFSPVTFDSHFRYMPASGAQSITFVSPDNGSDD
jgi:hypothetical protein